MDRGTKIKAYSAGVVFALLVGFSFLSVRVSVQIASPIEVLTFRYNFAFLAVCLTAAVFKSAGFNPKGKRKALACSGVFYLLFLVLQAFGLVFSTSVESAIIFATVPVIAKIIARFLLGETSTWQQNAFVGLSVSAVIIMVVMSAGDVEVNLLGIILLIFASIGMASANVLFRYVRAEHSPFSITFAISTIGFVVLNAWYIFYLLNAHGSLSAYFSPFADSRFVIATVYLGVPCIVFTSWLMGYMLKHMEAIRATIFGNLSTAISIIAGVVVLGEVMALYKVICTVIIVTGVIGVSAFARK